jgi:hypothetical protein
LPQARAARASGRTLNDPGASPGGASGLSEIVERGWMDDATSDRCVVVAEAMHLRRLWPSPRRKGDLDPVRQGLVEPETPIERRAPLQNNQWLAPIVGPGRDLSDQSGSNASPLEGPRTNGIHELGFSRRSDSRRDDIGDRAAVGGLLGADRHIISQASNRAWRIRPLAHPEVSQRQLVSSLRIVDRAPVRSVAASLPAQMLWR